MQAQSADTNPTALRVAKRLSLGCGGSRGGSGVSLEPPPRF